MILFRNDWTQSFLFVCESSGSLILTVTTKDKELLETLKDIIDDNMSCTHIYIYIYNDATAQTSSNWRIGHSMIDDQKKVGSYFAPGNFLLNNVNGSFQFLGRKTVCS